jgi:hypothetical protein
MTILSQQFIIDQVIQFLISRPPCIPRPNSTGFDDIASLIRVSGNVNQSVAASSLWRRTFSIITSAAELGYEATKMNGNVLRSSWCSEKGMLTCFKVAALTNPPPSFLPLLKMLITFNCDDCLTMTSLAAPFSGRRLCDACASRDENSVGIAASRAKDYCLLSDKDLAEVCCISLPIEEGQKLKLVGVPSRIYSASSVAERCLDKFGNLDAFEIAADDRRKKARVKYDKSQSTDKPRE